MGVVQRLGYSIDPPNSAQRALQRVASSRPAAWLLNKTLHHLDRALYRTSRGRITVPGLVARLPIVMLTTTGARTGIERTTPLVAIPLGDDLAVIGSNYGQQTTPGWVHNLLANPAATLSYRGSEVGVEARETEDVDEAFRVADDVYLGYAKYRNRAAERTIRVFILEERR